jgi:hypothetical protein
VNADELALRRAIMEAFAATGEPPDVDDEVALRGLAADHVVALDGDGRIRMAHPFAAHTDATRVAAAGRVWWGNCAWDGLGIVAALGLTHATVTSNGIKATGDALFHVAVPARDWWADIEFT